MGEFGRSVWTDFECRSAPRVHWARFAQYPCAPRSMKRGRVSPHLTTVPAPVSALECSRVEERDFRDRAYAGRKRWGGSDLITAPPSALSQRQSTRNLGVGDQTCVSCV